MFLIKFLKNRCLLIGAKERGSAMIAVLGIMGVAGAIGITTTSMSMHAVGYTTSTRAGVQAEAAAEAGVDYAAAHLATSVCQSQYSSTTAPVFAVTVSYSTLSTSPGAVDSSWVNGCPTTASAARLKLISTGTASSLGVAGNSSQDVRTVEAIYSYISAPSTYAVIPSGPALYSFAQVDPTINNLTVTQAGTVRPSIQFLSGSVTCTSGTTITGDVILGSGSLTVTSGCTINGDLSAAAGVNIQSGEVTGDVHSDDEHGDHTHAAVSLSSSSRIDGDVYSKGSVEIDGKVGGNIVAGPTSTSSNFSNQSSVGGSVVTSGSVTAPAGAIKGTVSTNQSGIVTPTIPVVPGWVDYAYNSNDWKTSTGVPYAVLTMTTCSSSDLSTAVNTAQNSPVPIVLDTRVCGPVTDFKGLNLSLISDTVILANGFNLASNNIQSANTVDKRLWIIIPDMVADGVPTCGTNSSAKIGNNVVVGSHVASLIYSPCPISNSGDVWRGQMYSSSIGTSSSFTLNFLPIGLPTVNLSTGQFLPPTGTGVLGSRTSIRDLVVG
jgi:cytoskeletal protein CcmA (bactofilin family)